MQQLTDSAKPRVPLDEATPTDPTHGLGLAHTRLSRLALTVPAAPVGIAGTPKLVRARVCTRNVTFVVMSAKCMRAIPVRVAWASGTA